MRNIAIAAALAATVVSGPTLAASANVTGSVAPFCEIRDLTLDYAWTSFFNGDSVSDDYVEVECNDPNGATITMDSDLGGLTNNDDPLGNKLPFTASLQGSVVNLTHDSGSAPTQQTINPNLTMATYPGDIAGFTVTLTGDPSFSGSYTDTININITAL